jgi:putative hemolysin
LLSWPADLVLKVLPVRSAPEVSGVEDILAAVDEGIRSGAIAPEGSHLLGNVFLLEGRRVAAIRFAEAACRKWPAWQKVAPWS